MVLSQADITIQNEILLTKQIGQIGVEKWFSILFRMLHYIATFTAVLVLRCAKQEVLRKLQISKFINYKIKSYA